MKYIDIYMSVLWPKAFTRVTRFQTTTLMINQIILANKQLKGERTKDSAVNIIVYHIDII